MLTFMYNRLFWNNINIYVCVCVYIYTHTHNKGFSPLELSEMGRHLSSGLNLTIQLPF